MIDLVKTIKKQFYFFKLWNCSINLYEDIVKLKNDLSIYENTKNKNVKTIKELCEKLDIIEIRISQILDAIEEKDIKRINVIGSCLDSLQKEYLEIIKDLDLSTVS